MDGDSTAALLKIVAQYGVLGLGWIAWVLTMVYLQAERKRYQALVIHIIQYFTKVNFTEGEGPKSLTHSEDALPNKHKRTFQKLFGAD